MNVFTFGMKSFCATTKVEIYTWAEKELPPFSPLEFHAHILNFRDKDD